MFENESKEYANKWLEHVKDLELQHKTDDKPEYIRIEEAHQKGAEFGYNFAKEEIDYLNKHWRSEEERKANEWHYVKDGDLPKSKNKVVCEDVLEYPFIAWYENGEWKDEIGRTLTTDVFKWKEIE